MDMEEGERKSHATKSTPQDKSPPTSALTANGRPAGNVGKEAAPVERSGAGVERLAGIAKMFSAKAKEKGGPGQAGKDGKPQKENGCVDDLPLGSEAHHLSFEHTNGIDSKHVTPAEKRSKWSFAQSVMGWQSRSFNSDVSNQTSASSASLDMLLNQRELDPEEMLLNLGFGGQTQSYVPSLARVPERFLHHPSRAYGIAAPGGSEEAEEGTEDSTAPAPATSGGTTGTSTATTGAPPAKKRTGGFFFQGYFFWPCEGYVDLMSLLDKDVPMHFFNVEGTKCYVVTSAVDFLRHMGAVPDARERERPRKYMQKPRSPARVKEQQKDGLLATRDMNKMVTSTDKTGEKTKLQVISDKENIENPAIEQIQIPQRQPQTASDISRTHIASTDTVSTDTENKEPVLPAPVDPKKEPKTHKGFGKFLEMKFLKQAARKLGDKISSKLSKKEESTPKPTAKRREASSSPDRAHGRSKSSTSHKSPTKKPEKHKHKLSQSYSNLTSRLCVTSLISWDSVHLDSSKTTHDGHQRSSSLSHKRPRPVSYHAPRSGSSHPDLSRTEHRLVSSEPHSTEMLAHTSDSARHQDIFSAANVNTALIPFADSVTETPSSLHSQSLVNTSSERTHTGHLSNQNPYKNEDPCTVTYVCGVSRVNPDVSANDYLQTVTDTFASGRNSSVTARDQDRYEVDEIQARFMRRSTKKSYKDSSLLTSANSQVCDGENTSVHEKSLGHRSSVRSSDVDNHESVVSGTCDEEMFDVEMSPLHSETVGMSPASSDSGQPSAVRPNSFRQSKEKFARSRSLRGQSLRNKYIRPEFNKTFDHHDDDVDVVMTDQVQATNDFRSNPDGCDNLSEAYAAAFARSMYSSSDVSGATARLPYTDASNSPSVDVFDLSRVSGSVKNSSRSSLRRDGDYDKLGGGYDESDNDVNDNYISLGEPIRQASGATSEADEDNPDGGDLEWCYDGESLNLNQISVSAAHTSSASPPLTPDEPSSPTTEEPSELPFDIPTSRLPSRFLQQGTRVSFIRRKSPDSATTSSRKPRRCQSFQYPSSYRGPVPVGDVFPATGDPIGDAPHRARSLHSKVIPALLAHPAAGGYSPHRSLWSPDEIFHFPTPVEVVLTPGSQDDLYTGHHAMSGASRSDGAHSSGDIPAISRDQESFSNASYFQFSPSYLSALSPSEASPEFSYPPPYKSRSNPDMSPGANAFPTYEHTAYGLSSSSSHPLYSHSSSDVYSHTPYVNSPPMYSGQERVSITSQADVHTHAQANTDDKVDDYHVNDDDSEEDDIFLAETAPRPDPRWDHTDLGKHRPIGVRQSKSFHFSSKLSQMEQEESPFEHSWTRPRVPLKRMKSTASCRPWSTKSTSCTSPTYSWLSPSPVDDSFDKLSEKDKEDFDMSNVSTSSSDSEDEEPDKHSSLSGEETLV